MNDFESNTKTLHPNQFCTQSVQEMTLEALRDEITHIEDGTILLVSFTDGDEEI